MNAWAAFQRMVDTVLEDLFFVCVYLDVIFIYTKNMEDHLMICAKQSTNLSRMGYKCRFSQLRMKLLV